MAYNKEAVVVIIDVGQNTRQEIYDDSEEKSFFDKQKKYCIELLQKKIFAGKKDEIAFILMGTNETDNELNRTLEGYDNIIEGVQMSIPNWNMLISLINSLDSHNTSNKSADWLDAIIVALDVLKREEAKKFKQLKIVLFHRFLSTVDRCGAGMAIEGIKTLDVELVVISDPVQYIDVSPSITKGIFAQCTEETHGMTKNSQSLITKIIEETNGVLCNFDIAIPRILHALRPKARPWFWHSSLDIGSKISIPICVTISIKEETRFKWETESIYPDATCWKTTEYFKNGEKFEPAPDELIKGYMLGSTPIPHDETLGLKKMSTEKSMKCLGFTDKKFVPPEYFSGSGTYLVLPKAGEPIAEHMMAALVQAMNESDLVLIVRRVFNNGYNPKFVALFPNMEREFPCLTLFELYTAEQQLHWEFPPLKNKKTQPTPEQYQAIDELMDAMNLDADDDDIDTTKPRKNYEKNLIPLNSLPNVTNDYICQLVTERVLQNSKNIISSLKGRDKAFQVPKEIIEKSSKAIGKIKELFPLKEVKKEGKRELIRHIGDISAQPSTSNADINVDENPLEYKILNTVGTVTPAEDYMALIKRDVENASDDDVRKGNFDRLSIQIRTIINNLIFKSLKPQYEKIREAIKAYNEQALFYNPYDYNDWIRELKSTIIARKMFDFWEDVIVKDELGLLCAKNCDFFDDMDDPEPVEFYKIKNAIVESTAATNDGEKYEDLFNDM